MVELDASIFNTQKTDYEVPSLFLGQEMGLLDSINKAYPEIFSMYKRLKKMDWDENDHSFVSCNTEFKTVSRDTYEMAIMSLSWQWEADSIAARSLISVSAPFITSTELFASWTEVTKNEILHGLTYSEIVRSSFDNPRDVLAKVLSINEALQRAHTVSKVFKMAYTMSHKLALGQVSRSDQSTYDAIFLFTVALWCMEKIQFMSSFAVTFGLAETGLFIPIADAVQKIAQDESVVHQALDKIVLEHELKTARGLRAFKENKQVILDMINEVVETEFAWNNTLFKEGRQLPGLTTERLDKHTLYHAADIYTFFGFVCPHEVPKSAPLPHLDKYFNINLVKGAPQEQRKGNYLVGGVVKNDTRQVIDLSDI